MLRIHKTYYWCGVKGLHSFVMRCPIFVVVHSVRLFTNVLCCVVNKTCRLWISWEDESARENILGVLAMRNCGRNLWRNGIFFFNCARIELNAVGKEFWFFYEERKTSIVWQVTYLVICRQERGWSVKWCVSMLRMSVHITRSSSLTRLGQDREKSTFEKCHITDEESKQPFSKRYFSQIFLRRLS